MGNLEVLLATMKRKNLSFLDDMNIQSDIVVANQDEIFEIQTFSLESCNVKWITTPMRGVGKNRNLSLAYSEAPFCLFSDDDVVYVDGYEKIIVDAFKNNPEVDIFIFDCKEIGNERAEVRKIEKMKRVHIWNFSRYGACRSAIRRSSWIKAGVFFSERFGGGTIYGSGEDTLFLRECIRKGLKLYTYPVEIAIVNLEYSSWFSGYNDKFFFDKGALVGALFPRTKYLLLGYFLLRFWRYSDKTFFKCLELMRKGINAEKNNISFEGKKN